MPISPLLKRLTLVMAVAPAIAVASACSDSTSPPSTATLQKTINHIVVIYLENHSFDNLYGQFPGANGLSSATSAPPQVDANDVVYDTLPEVAGAAFPTHLPNAPFNIEAYVPPTVPPRDLVHRYYQEQIQIDGGRMDRFVAIQPSLQDALGETMGYYTTANLPMYAEATKYTLCDNFYHSAFGGSFLNHIWLIAAAPPVFPGAPSTIVAQVDSVGGKLNVIHDGAVSPEGYGINTLQSVNHPHNPTTATNQLIPNQTMPTIGDRLTAGGVDWAWYAGGWNDALAGHPDPNFQFHHQPFVYFANYADGTAAKAAHLKDETDFMAAAAAGTLPPVSFVKPLGPENEHPGYAALTPGEQHTVQLINAVRNGPNWKDAIIIVTYDEHGGFWDHVAPPVIDRWGPGSRVPTIIISPYAKTGNVDHTQYETSSILALIEKRWSLAPLGTRDANAAPFTNAFDFSQSHQ